MASIRIKPKELQGIDFVRSISGGWSGDGQGQKIKEYSKESTLGPKTERLDNVLRSPRLGILLDWFQ